MVRSVDNKRCLASCIVGTRLRRYAWLNLVCVSRFAASSWLIGFDGLQVRGSDVDGGFICSLIL